MRVAALLLVLGMTLACSRPQPTSASDVALTGKDGAERTFRAIAGEAPFTVAVFVAADCPCLHAHLARIRELAALYGPRGVQFVGVDSELGAGPARSKQLEKELELPFPVLADPGARLANGVGAEFATFTVIVDRGGQVRYRGGIDSDKRKLHEAATPYVKDALDDLLAGKAPRRAEGKALGCVLRKW